MSLNVLQCLRMAGLVSLMGLVTGCGEDGGTPASSAGMVIIAPTSLPAPTPTPTQTPTVVVTMPGAVIVQSGDSIGSGAGAGDWAAIDHLGFADDVTVHNVSVPGKTMQTGYGMLETELFPFRSSSVPSVLLIQQGTNDLYHGTSASLTYQAILVPFVSSARAAGFYVVANTVLPRADSGWTAAMEQQRIAYNMLVRANTAGADAVNDIAADPLLGDGSDPATSDLYADALHLSRKGQERVATLDAAVLSPFLQRPVRTPSR
jgi:lysophospholipase L1-like esterase